MTIRNERVERQECEETKKNESTMTRIEKERLYAQTINVIDQQEDNFFFFIKCMQSMTITLSRRCMLDYM